MIDALCAVTPVSLYPIMIVEDRYGGSYSGGQWVAVAEAAESPHRDAIDESILGGDTACMMFWSDPPQWVAVGATPDEALGALLAKYGRTW